MSPTKRPTPTSALPAQRPARPVVLACRPSVDSGRRHAKAILGEELAIEADVIVDGHDVLRCEVRHRHEDDRRAWTTASLELLGNDTYRAAIRLSRLGRHEFVVRAWIDRFATWRRDTLIKKEVGAEITADLEHGLLIVRDAARRSTGANRAVLQDLLESLSNGSAEEGLLDEALVGLLASEVDPTERVEGPAQAIRVERTRAAFGSWYEMFARSAGDSGEHGTLTDVTARLPYLASLGIDVLYLAPIHPIGATDRKGKDGSTNAAAGDPGSPWAIGSPLGGHLAIHPELGTLEDFAHLLEAAAALDIELALDLAFQCSPDHPWVHEHPAWFRHRPDGSIQYAENPPKRYEDIYPLDFESADWQALWSALLGVVQYWIDRGVRIFRVDNPHTKPFAFWEWLIATVHQGDPGVIFLSEAFTRPKVMYHLAKVGFSQSYTYFTWRNSKSELESYLRELTGPGVIEFFRPNLWTNTPDILTSFLQDNGRPAFAIRAMLAATLGASWGIYGPAFELGENTPRTPGSEEYAGSEKYQLRRWNLSDPTSLAPFIATLNTIRRGHLPLQQDRTLLFHHVESPELIAYSKTTPEWLKRAAEGAVGPILCVVNLDPHHPQSGWVDLDLPALGIAPGSSYVVHDLLSGARYHWVGASNFVLLDPAVSPGHLFEILPDDGEDPGTQSAIRGTP